jgi:hypothetical protein
MISSPMRTWPDGESIGPYARITDSLSPRYVALLIAAALLERSRGGGGQPIDVAQLETGLQPEMRPCVRTGNRRAVGTASGRGPHGVYPAQARHGSQSRRDEERRRWSPRWGADGARVSAMTAPPVARRNQTT